MAVDTRDKRASALLTLGIPLPDPDGAIGAADRIHLGGFYRGLTAPVAAAPEYDDILVAVASLASTSGAVRVQIGEPVAPPDVSTRPVLAVSMGPIIIHALMLNGGTLETQGVVLRFYERFLDEDGRGMLRLMEAVQSALAAILLDADLGGLVRHVDAAGAYGDRLTGDFGFQNVGGTMFRVCEVNMPLLVDDARTLAL